LKIAIELTPNQDKYNTSTTANYTRIAEFIPFRLDTT
jgi:hypothetical protein